MNKRKDQKIQLYRKESVQVEGSTKVTNYRRFIYSQDQNMSGGLWANARDMSVSEVVSTGMQQQVDNI